METLKLDPLNEKEKKEIFDLSQSPDPTARLKSNYYQLRRRQLYQDYVTDLQSKDYHDHCDRKKLQQEMEERLSDLKAEYDADISLATELYLATLNVWQPWRAAS